MSIQLKKDVPSKLRGFVYGLTGCLLLFAGVLVHFYNGIAHLYFFEYVTLGFLAGVYCVSGVMMIVRGREDE